MTIIDKRRGNGAGSDAAQQATQRAIDTNVPDHIKTGVKLTNVQIGTAAGGAAIQHKLGRAPAGWHVLRVTNPTGTGTNSELVEHKSDDNTLTLGRPTTGTGSFAYDLWVF